jgi:hypothetical protein
LRVITANQSGGYKKRLLSSGTQAAEPESLLAGEPEAYSHNQGLFVVWRFQRHSDGGRVVTSSVTQSQSEGPQDNET